MMSWPRFLIDCLSPSRHRPLTSPHARIGFPIAIYSHRGGPMESPGCIENSMEAFHHSMQLGVDLLELDVRMTKDKHLIVHHDVDIMGKGKVREMCYHELPPLRYSPLTRVPLLSQILAASSRFPLQVDIKADEPGIVEATLKAIDSTPGCSDRILIGSFNHRLNQRIFKLRPSLPLFCSTYRLIYLAFWYQLLGSLRSIAIHEAAAIVPWHSSLLLPTYLRRYFSFSLLHREFFKELNSKGVAVIVFGRINCPDFNSMETFEACKKAGANAICTDKPSLLMEFIKLEGPLEPLPWLK